MIWVAASDIQSMAFISRSDGQYHGLSIKEDPTSHLDKAQAISRPSLLSFFPSGIVDSLSRYEFPTDWKERKPRKEISSCMSATSFHDGIASYHCWSVRTTLLWRGRDVQGSVRKSRTLRKSLDCLRIVIEVLPIILEATNIIPIAWIRPSKVVYR